MASHSGSRDVSPYPRSPLSARASPRSPWSTCGSSLAEEDEEAATAANIKPRDDEPEDETVKYRVCLLGHNGTGKTALVTQFLTSEYMNTYDASLGNSRALMQCGP